MDALRNISSSVTLLEQMFSLSTEKRLDEAVDGDKSHAGEAGTIRAQI